MATCSWPIGNGQSINFEVYDKNEGWAKVAGLYIFTYLINGSWYPLYVGQCDDFSCRFPNHERLEQAVQLGATHIHAAVVPNSEHRNILEQALISHLQPVMNTHHR